MLFSVPVYRLPPQPRTLRWTGAFSNDWNTSSENWVINGTSTPATFAAGDRVIIEPSVATTIVLDPYGVYPSRTYVVSDAATVTLTGGSLMSGSLWLKGPNTITLDQENSHNGGTRIGRLDDNMRYLTCGVNNFSFWTKTVVSILNARALGSTAISVELGGVSAACVASVGKTRLSLNGLGGYYTFDIPYPEAVEIVP